MKRKYDLATACLEQKIIDAIARQLIARRKYQAYTPQKEKSGG